MLQRIAVGLVLGVFGCTRATVPDSDRTDDSADSAVVEPDSADSPATEAADSPSDEDSPVDTDDSDVPPMVGTVDFQEWIDGDLACDAVIAFSGAPYTGDCEGCDFSFNVDETQVIDEQVEGCDYTEEFAYSLIAPEDSHLRLSYRHLGYVDPLPR